jgi:hypothetical protein
MAEILINNVYNFKWIAEEAGTADFETHCSIVEDDVSHIVLVVDDVEQSNLDAALEKYIPQHDVLTLTIAQEGAMAAIDRTAIKIRQRAASAIYDEDELATAVDAITQARNAGRIAVEEAETTEQVIHKMNYAITVLQEL